MPRQDCNKNTCIFGNVVLGQVTLSWWGSHRLDCTTYIDNVDNNKNIEIGENIDIWTI